jgi:hypothetical protein
MTANDSGTCPDCGSDSSNVTDNQTKTFVFIQEGESGTLVSDGSGNYTLTMFDVVPYTIFLSDRPAREVGLTPIDKFLSGFNFGLNNPPNAAIILSEENETSDTALVELTNPQYNNTTRTLTYTATLLKEYQFESEWYKGRVGAADASIPESFGKVSLVIDDCPCEQDVNGPCSAKTTCRNSCWQSKPFPWCYKCGGCCPCSHCAKSC